MVSTRSSLTPKKSINTSEAEEDDFRVVSKRDNNPRCTSSSDEPSNDKKDTVTESENSDEEDEEEGIKRIDVEDDTDERNDTDKEDGGAEEEAKDGDDEDEEELDDNNKDKEIQKTTTKKGKEILRPSSTLDLSGFYGFKCYFERLIIEGKEIMERFDKTTIGILYKTPFGEFFKAINSGRITTKMVGICSENSNSILDVIGKYTKVGNGFRFNNKSNVVDFKEFDVGLIFGMPLKGQKFEPNGKPSGKPGRFEKKYLYKSTKRITKTDLINEVKSLLGKKNKSDEERVDLVKLFLLWSFGMFFFCSTNGGVSRMMIRKFENFGYVNSCSWPSIIHSYLMNSMELNKNNHTGVSGCVILLLYFLLEHCDITDPIKGLENECPRMIKWDLSRITGRNWIGWYKRLEFVKVNGALDNLSDTEKKLVSISDDVLVEDDDFVDADKNKEQHQTTEDIDYEMTNPSDTLAVVVHEIQVPEIVVSKHKREKLKRKKISDKNFEAKEKRDGKIKEKKKEINTGDGKRQK